MAIYSNENSCFFERKIHKAPMTMLRAHYHNTHELYFLEKGKTKYFIGNEIFVLEPGDMVFIPKFVFHKTDNERNANVERLRFSFDDGFVGEYYQKYIDELKKNYYIKIPIDKQPELKDIIKRIEYEGKREEKDYHEMQRLQFIQLLIIISRYCTTNQAQLNASEQLIQQLAKHISENCDSELSLEILSKKYAMSPGHLCRMFKKNMGLGLSEYINISRITAAEKLLRTTNKPITQIATECGFNDSNYFASIFKKYKGITPKKFHLQEKEK